MIDGDKKGSVAAARVSSVSISTGARVILGEGVGEIVSTAGSAVDPSAVVVIEARVGVKDNVGGATMEEGKSVKGVGAPEGSAVGLLLV